MRKFCIFALVVPQGRVTGQELLTRTLEEAQAAGDPDYFGLASYEGSFVVRLNLHATIVQLCSCLSVIVCLQNKLVVIYGCITSTEMDNYQQATKEATEW